MRHQLQKVFLVEVRVVQARGWHSISFSAVLNLRLAKRPRLLGCISLM